MVHRAADSRLLSNLLQHEKEYTKQLSTLLDTSNASLTSLAAYAAASPQPLSQVIMVITGSLAAADDALRRYAHSVEIWRETMARLKDMEDEVGNIIRDREILVTRLIKASRSSKPGSGIIAASVRSSSSLSLSNSQDPSSSRPISLTFSTSSKLNTAQSELQACELHLATKERELANSRSAALHEGLGARLKALVDCGWAWGELGKEGLRSLETLQLDSGADDSGPNLKGTDTDSFLVNASSESGISSISPSQSASQINHDHHDGPPPVFLSFRSTELLSAPPLTAELSTNTVRPLSMATTNTVTTSGSGTSTPAHAALLAATTSTLTYAPAVAVHIPPSSPPSAVGISSGAHAKEHETETTNRSEVHLPIPPPHALGGEYVNIPLAEMVDAVNTRLGEVVQNHGRSPSRSSLSDKTSRGDDGLVEHHRVVRLMEKRVTEVGSVVEGADEKEHVHDEYLYEETVESQADEPQEYNAMVDTSKEGNTNNRNAMDPESSSDEVQVLQNLDLVENPRFMSERQRKGAGEKKKKVSRGKERERMPFGSPQSQGGIRGATIDKNPKPSSPSPSKTFLGSLRGFFGSKDKSAPPTQSTPHLKQKSRTNAAISSDSESSDDGWPSPTSKRRKKVLKTLLFRPLEKKTTSAGAKLELGRGSLDSSNGSVSGLGSGLKGNGGRMPVGGKLQATESTGTKGDSEGWTAAIDAVKRVGITASSMGRVKAGSVDKLDLVTTGKKGNHKGRTRASSDVGASIAGASQSHPYPGQRQQTARRLKKNRIVADEGVIERGGSSESEELGGGGIKPTKHISVLGGPPVAGSAAVAKATWLKDYPASAAASASDQNKNAPLVDRPGTSRRSNSVDIGVASRRKERRESYILIDHPDKGVLQGAEGSLGSPTLSSSKAQIIDLGESRAREMESVQNPGKDDKSANNSAALTSVLIETGKVPSRSSSLSSPRKVTAVLAIPFNEEGSLARTDRRLSRDSSFRSKGGGDVAKTRRTDTLGQSSFNSVGTKTLTSPSRPVGPLRPLTPASVSIPKSASSTIINATSKPTSAAAPASESLMSIVEDVKRTREANQIATSPSATSGAMVEVVKAPPRTNREGLENFAGHGGVGRTGGEMSADKAAGSALFRVQAPGSVFDHKPQTSTGSTPSPSVSALGVGVLQRHGPGQVIKTPLKSALKNTSRTPSPSPPVVSASLPLAASTSVPKASNTHLGLPFSVAGQGPAGVESESVYESGEEEFFTDEGDPDGESDAPNGHANVEDSPAGQSATTTVRTVLCTPSDQTPRKRKSVRVSLKPTFSPSPPAIEYDEEENFDKRAFSSHRFPKPDTVHPPTLAKHKISSHGEAKQDQKWEDSSDEDEGYTNAKAALSRAARKDKEVSLSVLGH